jgi:cellulose synthase/poly-beta-1,6-N-acetylglucosamine synthase-like glycosyltransferase
MFALDYALWFDYLLPGLDRLGIPMPLGGTSNHFRTAALRAIHGWDPYNVTEDADLGIRLARLGMRVRTLDSTTFEEATNSFGNWLRQRSRWLKGYMQTWLVHMRSPLALLRHAGIGGFIGFQLFVGGTFLSALINPFLWLGFAISSLFGFSLLGASSAAFATHTSILSLIAGNGLFAYLAMLAPFRRGWLELTPYGLTAPFYWLLVSLAGARAFYQLFANPWHWEKTAHGLSNVKIAAAK